MILWISSGVLLIGIGLLIYGNNTSHYDMKENLIGWGLLLSLISIVVGFCLIASLVPVKTISPVYLEPSSAFCDEKCVVAVLNDKRYYTNIAIDVNKAKNGVIKISQTKQYNSYNIELMPNYDLAVFSKEEWEKINQTIKLEK